MLIITQKNLSGLCPMSMTLMVVLGALLIQRMGHWGITMMMVAVFAVGQTETV